MKFYENDEKNMKKMTGMPFCALTYKGVSHCVPSYSDLFKYMLYLFENNIYDISVLGKHGGQLGFGGPLGDEVADEESRAIGKVTFSHTLLR